MQSTTSLLRPAVLGAVDGLITTFVLVAAGLASKVPPAKLVVVGIASLFGEALSMGVGEYLSSRHEVGRWAVVKGVACATSFAVVGVLPLLGYVLDTTSAWPSAVALATGLTAVGAARALLGEEEEGPDGQTRGTKSPTGAEKRLLRRLSVGVIETIALGAAAGGLAYGTASL